MLHQMSVHQDVHGGTDSKPLRKLHVGYLSCLLEKERIEEETNANLDIA